jgi:hypothetical protein
LQIILLLIKALNIILDSNVDKINGGFTEVKAHCWLNNLRLLLEGKKQDPYEPESKNNLQSVLETASIQNNKHSVTWSAT